MNQKFVLIMIITAGLFSGGGTALAQNRPYDVVMKDIGAAFGILNDNLNSEDSEDSEDSEAAAPMDAASAAAAIEAVDDLDRLFAETEAFWTQFNAQYAVGLAIEAREGAATVRSGANAGDIEMAQQGYRVIQRTCGNCHYTHREITDSGFRIRP